MSTLLTRIARWIDTLSIDAIPPRVQRKLRFQVASALSASAASPWHEPSKAVLRSRQSQAGDSLVFATGDRLQPADAAYVNAAFAMSLDMDDYLLSGHTCYSAILVPLAFAQTLDEVLVAAAAANEVMGRLSTACLIGPINGQMSSYIHNIGAAIALGKVRGLSADALARAMGIALYQPSFCLAPGFWDEGSKTITASQPLEQGIRAVELAEAGLSGPIDILDHPLGFFSVFAFENFAGLFDALGEVWFSDTLCYKRYPGTSYISAAVEATLELTGGRALAETDVERVRVETTVLSATLDSIGAAAIARTPLDANAVNFSVRLSVAAALHFGQLTPDDLRPERLAEAEPTLRALANKVEVVHDWAQTMTMMADTPLGLALLSHLSPTAWVKTIAHGRRMNRASGSVGRNRSRFRGVLRTLPQLMKALSSARRLRVSDRHFDAQHFNMRQSARVQLSRAHPGGTAQVQVDIPDGACGRPETEVRALISDRLEQAFGPRASAIERCVNDEVGALQSLEVAIGALG